jgi:putative zinc finger/helix-turn-helix YgiT family protein
VVAIVNLKSVVANKHCAKTAEGYCTCHLSGFDSKRLSMGYLVSQEIVNLRNSLNLTQAQAAKAFGGGLNAFSKYERGEVIQSGSMDKLMRMVRRNPARLVELIDILAPNVSSTKINLNFEKNENVLVGKFHTKINSASNDQIVPNPDAPKEEGNASPLAA